MRDESDRVGRERAVKVKGAMQHAWQGYREFAWGADELAPRGKKPKQPWGAMGVTLVDSLGAFFFVFVIVFVLFWCVAFRCMAFIECCSASFWVSRLVSLVDSAYAHMIKTFCGTAVVAFAREHGLGCGVKELSGHYYT